MAPGRGRSTARRDVLSASYPRVYKLNSRAPWEPVWPSPEGWTAKDGAINESQCFAVGTRRPCRRGDVPRRPVLCSRKEAPPRLCPARSSTPPAPSFPAPMSPLNIPVPASSRTAVSNSEGLFSIPEPADRHLHGDGHAAGVQDRRHQQRRAHVERARQRQGDDGNRRRHRAGDRGVVVGNRPDAVVHGVDRRSTPTRSRKLPITTPQRDGLRQLAARRHDARTATARRSSTACRAARSTSRSTASTSRTTRCARPTASSPSSARASTRSKRSRCSTAAQGAGQTPGRARCR